MLEHLRAPFSRTIAPKALIAIGLTANDGDGDWCCRHHRRGHRHRCRWLSGGAVVLTLLVLADSLEDTVERLWTPPR